MNNDLFNCSRRRFLKSTTVASVASLSLTPTRGLAREIINHTTPTSLLDNTIRFNGERRDPVTGTYYLGNGYRMYNPRLMRFQAVDNISPFGKGGINGYAYCLGDPINQRDPSGHFALLSLLIGAIIGSVVCTGISVATEGIKCLSNPEHKFDWKQVGISAALGFISGGFGVAAKGATTAVKVGLALADSAVSSSADFGLNVAAGTPVKEAGVNAGIGAIVGLVSFTIGSAIDKLKPCTRNLSSNGNDSRHNFLLRFRPNGNRMPSGWSWIDGPLASDSATHQIWGVTRRTDCEDILTNPIEMISHRPSISDVNVYSGTHGWDDGDNWLHFGSRFRNPRLKERYFYDQDIRHIPRALANRGREVYIHDISFAKFTDFTHYIENKPGHHVLAFCYSAVDDGVRDRFLPYL
ncbi:hypothetical protein L4D04_18290 [Photobacterium angustum]|uniref:RHS repeat-associated core domain-containing protein n=1 Tax=Photobacterium angustum TaxID=661 RepID=UPI003D0ABFE1